MRNENGMLMTVDGKGFRGSERILSRFAGNNVVGQYGARFYNRIVSLHGLSSRIHSRWQYDYLWNMVEGKADREESREMACEMD